MSRARGYERLSWLSKWALILVALLSTQCIQREPASAPAPHAEKAAPPKTNPPEETPPTMPSPEPIPVLQTKNGTTQLFVDGAPFFVLGGELGNSSASDDRYMRGIWPKLRAMHLNTLLAPVYWELIEPKEGKYDFSSLEWLIERARLEDLRLVLLWFGSWKNSMSCYAPSWVKRDQARFSRARDGKGVAQEILSPFDDDNLAADRNAYAHLMRFLREFDGVHRTVIMVQVENEIGMLPSARDHHPAASEAFGKPVPRELLDYLGAPDRRLVPEVAAVFGKGGKKAGTWEEVFGKSPATDEIFMAWHFGRYVDAIAQAGKKEYPLPLFVNAALNRPGVLPGDYPSAGPLPHVMDVWKAAAPSIDLLVPDFYNPDFSHWNDLYTQQGDALFIPEIRFDETVGAKALFAFGRYNTLGFSPFSIESTEAPGDSPIAKSYELLHQVLPLVASHEQAHIEGVWLTKEAPEMRFEHDGYRIIARHDLTLGWDDEAKASDWPHGGAIIIRTEPETFIVAGTGVVLTFESLKAGARAGIDEIYEGKFVDGRWQKGRSMNGDQSHQGRHLRIPNRSWEIQKLRLYTYE